MAANELPAPARSGREHLQLIAWTFAVFAAGLIFPGLGVLTAVMLALTKYQRQWWRISILVIVGLLPLVGLATLYLSGPSTGGVGPVQLVHP